MRINRYAATDITLYANPTPDQMVTFLFTSFLVLAAIAVAIYFWQKPAKSSQSFPLPETSKPRSLFEPQQPDSGDMLTPKIEESLRLSLLERAQTGDNTVLVEAQKLNDHELSNQLLDALVGQVQTPAQFLALDSYVSRNSLRVNKTLAVAAINGWKETPNKNATSKMLHIAALSDDAETYRHAVELALSFWREGKLAELSAWELQALLNGEFWVLSSGTRSSGPGFILKRTLSSARRELEENVNN